MPQVKSTMDPSSTWVQPASVFEDIIVVVHDRWGKLSDAVVQYFDRPEVLLSTWIWRYQEFISSLFVYIIFVGRLIYICKCCAADVVCDGFRDICLLGLFIPFLVRPKPNTAKVLNTCDNNLCSFESVRLFQVPSSAFCESCVLPLNTCWKCRNVISFENHSTSKCFENICYCCCIFLRYRHSQHFSQKNKTTATNIFKTHIIAKNQ